MIQISGDIKITQDIKKYLNIFKDLKISKGIHQRSKNLRIQFKRARIVFSQTPDYKPSCTTFLGSYIVKKKTHNGRLSLCTLIKPNQFYFPLKGS